MRRFLVLLPLAATLTGCISLLPKTDPVQMYRFGYDAAAAEAAQPGVPVALAFGGASLPPGTAGDGIMTVENNEVAYVAEARWSAGAQALFNEAVQAGFARSGGNVRLETRGRAAAPYRLDISVRRFETRYDRNRPTVAVAMDVRVIRQSDRLVLASQYVEHEVPATRNNMRTIVDAYNTAVTAAIADVIAFSQETLSPVAPPPTAGDLPAGTKPQVEGL